MKTGSARRVVGSPQTAAMRLNDGPADGESHTRAVRLGGKERLENLVPLLRGQTHSAISDGHQNLLVFRSLRFDSELARPMHILHRIHAIEHEVHQHLMKLQAIYQDIGKICGQLRSDRYVVSRCLAAQEDDHLSHDFVYVYELPLRSALLEEQTDPADDFRRTHSVFRASHGSRARFFHFWGVAR